jgi:hypothetical protein
MEEVFQRADWSNADLMQYPMYLMRRDGNVMVLSAGTRERERERSRERERQRGREERGRETDRVSTRVRMSSRTRRPNFFLVETEGEGPTSAREFVLTFTTLDWALLYLEQHPQKNNIEIIRVVWSGVRR